MKIYNQNATALLFEKAKSLTQSHDSWRCIYFNFSDHKDEYSDGLRTHFVVKIIKDLLADYEGMTFLCEDQDIFILFQGAIKPMLARLGEHFEGLKSDQVATQPKDNLFTVFDLSQHWQIFFNLCKAKAMQLQAQQAQAVAAAATTTLNASKAPSSAAPKITEPNVKQFEAAEQKRAGRRQMTVLVVEDDAFTRRLISSILKVNYEVVEAGDASEAFTAYSTHAPDAVFLDIELPDLNGQVVLQKLVAMDNDAFIVMLSASSFKENILAALEVGAQGFVTKPFAKEKLLHYLNMCESSKHPHSAAPKVIPVTSNPSQENRV